MASTGAISPAEAISEIAKTFHHVQADAQLLEPIPDNEDGNTPLIESAKNCDVRLVSLILSLVSNLETRNKNEETALHVAASQGHAAAVEELLKAGAEIEAKNKEGETSLHLAASGGHAAVAAVLLKRGADTRARGWGGSNPLEYTSLAAFHKQIDVLATAAVLESYMQGSALHRAALVDDASAEEEVATALRGGAKTKDATKEEEDTALHLAARCGDAEMTEMLIQAGANLNFKNKPAGYTPLHWAAYRGHPEVAGALLRAKANTKLKDAEGRTALEAAQHAGHSEVVVVLGGKA